MDRVCWLLKEKPDILSVLGFPSFELSPIAEPDAFLHLAMLF